MKQAITCTVCTEEVILGYAARDLGRYVCVSCEEDKLLRSMKRREALRWVLVSIVLLLALSAGVVAMWWAQTHPTHDPIQN